MDKIYRIEVFYPAYFVSFFFNFGGFSANFLALRRIYFLTYIKYKIMRRAQIFLFILTVFCFSATGVFAQQTSEIVKKDLSQAEIDRIVRTITENEVKFREALSEYVFNRKATIQTVGMGGQITGTYHRESFMTFSKDGKRFENITYFPVSTLTTMSVTPEDLEDLGGVNPFALEPSAIPLYNFTYVGKQRIDELDLYVFDITPKVIPNPKKSKQRLFTGRIWVDDKDLMIVKSKGKAVPETKDNKFPVVETWRENVEGKYWFPSYASSDDELFWDNGYSVKLKMRVNYTDYAQGRTEIRIVEDEDEIIEQTPPPPPAKKP